MVELMPGSRAWYLEQQRQYREGVQASVRQAMRNDEERRQRLAEEYKNRPKSSQSLQTLPVSLEMFK